MCVPARREGQLVGATNRSQNSVGDADELRLREVELRLGTWPLYNLHEELVNAAHLRDGRVRERERGREIESSATGATAATRTSAHIWRVA